MVDAQAYCSIFTGDVSGSLGCWQKKETPVTNITLSTRSEKHIRMCIALIDEYLAFEFGNEDSNMFASELENHIHLVYPRPFAFGEHKYADDEDGDGDGQSNDDKNCISGSDGESGPES